MKPLNDHTSTEFVFQTNLKEVIPLWKILSIQNSNSPLIEIITFFHDYVSIIICLITTLVAVNLIFILKRKVHSSFFKDNHTLENFWLIIPIIILVVLGFPRIKNLYISEEICNPDLTFKVQGYQWYWSYRFENKETQDFDRIIEKTSYNRLLETNNHLIVPVETPIRFIISSNDVIHSWTIPSLGIKSDALPGRINQLFAVVNRPGLYVGQCREICGANHRFIPIVISAIAIKTFISSLIYYWN